MSKQRTRMALSTIQKLARLYVEGQVGLDLHRDHFAQAPEAFREMSQEHEYSFRRILKTFAWIDAKEANEDYDKVLERYQNLFDVEVEALNA